MLYWVTPGLSGIELLRRLRRKAADKRLPILLVASIRDASDAGFAISNGADDVVTAPFSLGEIPLWISALLRRPRTQDLAETQQKQDVVALRLNPTTERLLAVLSGNARRVLARRQIHEILWGYVASFDKHALDVHIARLRQFLQCRLRVDPIECVGDEGYRYVCE